MNDLVRVLIYPESDSTKFFATKLSGQLSASMANKTLRQAVIQLDIVLVQKLLGHASLKTTSIYTHASMEELSEAVNTF